MRKHKLWEDIMGRLMSSLLEPQVNNCPGIILPSAKMRRISPPHNVIKSMPQGTLCGQTTTRLCKHYDCLIKLAAISSLGKRNVLFACSFRQWLFKC